MDIFTVLLVQVNKNSLQQHLRCTPYEVDCDATNVTNVIDDLQQVMRLHNQCTSFLFCFVFSLLYHITIHTFVAGSIPTHV